MNFIVGLFAAICRMISLQSLCRLSAGNADTLRYYAPKMPAVKSMKLYFVVKYSKETVFL